MLIIQCRQPIIHASPVPAQVVKPSSIQKPLPICWTGIRRHVSPLTVRHFNDLSNIKNATLKRVRHTVMKSGAWRKLEHLAIDFYSSQTILHCYIILGPYRTRHGLNRVHSAPIGSYIRGNDHTTGCPINSFRLLRLFDVLDHFGIRRHGRLLKIYRFFFTVNNIR